MIDLSKKLRRAVEWAALPWPWFLVLLSGILIGAGWLIAAGPATQDEWAGDIFAFIDGAWRVMQGQRPHVDFNTSLGFGFFLIMALGFELFGMSIHAVPGLLALLGVTIALWCWAVSITRLRPWMAALLSLVAGFYVLGPAPPGLDFHLSYGGMYNKLGHSLLLILCCDAVAPSIGPSSRWREALLGISTGTILCIFATTKLTFLFPAVAAIAFSAIFLRRGRVWWGGLGASLAVGVIATTIYLRGDPLAMLRDFFFVMRARGNRVGEHTHLPLIMQMTLRTLAVGWGKPLEFVRLELEHLAMLALGALLLATGSPILKEDRARLVAILFLLPTATAVALTSWQWSDVPMIAFLGILLAEGAVRGRAHS
jgi:hypothetical protein